MRKERDEIWEYSAVYFGQGINHKGTGIMSVRSDPTSQKEVIAMSNKNQNKNEQNQNNQQNRNQNEQKQNNQQDKCDNRR